MQFNLQVYSGKLWFADSYFPPVMWANAPSNNSNNTKNSGESCRYTLKHLPSYQKKKYITNSISFGLQI